MLALFAKLPACSGNNIHGVSAVGEIEGQSLDDCQLEITQHSSRIHESLQHLSRARRHGCMTASACLLGSRAYSMGNTCISKKVLLLYHTYLIVNNECNTTYLVVYHHVYGEKLVENGWCNMECAI